MIQRIAARATGIKDSDVCTVRGSTCIGVCDYGQSPMYCQLVAWLLTERDFRLQGDRDAVKPATGPSLEKFGDSHRPRMAAQLDTKVRQLVGGMTVTTMATAEAAKSSTRVPPPLK